MELYHHTSNKISSIVTKSYSNSFYLSSLLLEKNVREAIHGIYGFVRFADEIVDTFHNFDKEYLLNKFETDLNDALKNKISLNPILNSFQLAVNNYNIPYSYIESFLKSMRMDLEKTKYSSTEETNEYIYGSADVVGLMCLRVFCNKNNQKFDELVLPATKLGSAFQKVNFLRDLKADTQELNRNYFSTIDVENFDEKAKNELYREIENDFNVAYSGLKKLPGRSKLAVLAAFYYYKSLLIKIRNTPARIIINKRIRISNSKKIILLIRALIEYKLKLV